MESCPTQAVLPLVGLAAEKVIRDRYKGNTDRAETPSHPEDSSRQQSELASLVKTSP
ncbi:MAG: hypothetical protein ACQESR_21880 [Planctomycetota bacterium]